MKLIIEADPGNGGRQFAENMKFAIQRSINTNVEIAIVQRAQSAACDVASLGIVVDTSAVRAATEDLKRFADAADRANKSVSLHVRQ